MKYIFKSNYSNPRKQPGTMGLTIARLASVSSPGLHPSAGALVPCVVPHRVLPQLTHSLQLTKLPGRTFTVASGHIKSSCVPWLSQGSVFFNYFAEMENIMWGRHWTGPLGVTNKAGITNMRTNKLLPSIRGLFWLQLKYPLCCPAERTLSEISWVTHFQNRSLPRG